MPNSAAPRTRDAGVDSGQNAELLSKRLRPVFDWARGVIGSDDSVVRAGCAVYWQAGSAATVAASRSTSARVGRRGPWMSRASMSRQ